MAAGDIKLAYAASVDLDVTNLHDSASSATWIAGWNSAVIDNTANLYSDYLISGLIATLHDVASTVGQVRVYVVSMVSDTVWPDTITAVEAAPITWTNSGMRDSSARLAAVIRNAITVDLLYPFGQVSVADLFGGKCPPKFVIWITHSMVQTLDHAGSIVTQQGVYHTVAS